MLNVLWIEDEPESFPYERMLAIRMGWKITDISNKETAIKQINNYKYDLIITDLIIAENEWDNEHGHVSKNVGLQVIKEIRNKARVGKTDRDVEIIVISAVTSKDTKNEVITLLSSLDNYWSKPELINKEDVRKKLLSITEKIRKKMS